MENQKTIIQLHEEHRLWLNTLAFYMDELAIMQGRIEEIAAKNTGREVLALVEHFQNQLILRKEQIDTLLHSIREHEAFLEKEADKKAASVDHARFGDHAQLRNTIGTFETSFNELRKELIGFLVKWM